MASNSNKNNTANVTDGSSTTPIKLQKTMNITKIKGWRKKKFNLEYANKEIDNKNCIENVAQMATERGDNSSLCAVTKTKPKSDAVLDICSLNVGSNLLKINRNPDLLDSLVKKIGDVCETGCRSQASSVQKNLQLNSVSETVSRSPLCKTNDSKEGSVDSMRLIHSGDKAIPFERSAFVSESLDNFLSNEPAILKLNGALRSPTTESMKVVQAKNTPERSIKVVENDLKRSTVSAENDLLKKYGSKPKTLAEKRRILENRNYHRRNKRNKKDSERNMKFNNYRRLKRALCFKRKCKMKGKRMLRSNFSLAGDDALAEKYNKSVDCVSSYDDDDDDDSYSTEEIYENDNHHKVLNDINNYTKNNYESHNTNQISEDCISTGMKDKYYNLDRVFDSVVNNTDSVSLERGYRTIPSSEELKLRSSRLPHRVNKRVKRGRLRNYVLHNIDNKARQSRNAIDMTVYNKPLKKRIPYDFMSCLNAEEIVKYNPDLNFQKKVCMVLFLGIGRCLYQEQLENLEAVRKDVCTIDDNFVKFATSTVLDRRNPYKYNRVLLPVVSTKLLTFMNSYDIIRARYQHFLIDKFKIKVPGLVVLKSNDTLSKNVGDDKSGDNDQINFNIKPSSSQLEQYIKISNDNDLFHVTKSESKFFKGTNGADIKSEMVDSEIKSKIPNCYTSCKVSPNNNEGNSDWKLPKTEIKFKKRVIKNGRIFHEDKKMTKLSYELRRLNHGFLEVESPGKVLPETVLPNDVLPNKLAKVESEFHQTIMKSNKEFVFISPFGERSQRRRKLPKKLEGTVFSNETTSSSNGYAYNTKKKIDRIDKSEGMEIEKMRRPQSTVRDVPHDDSKLEQYLLCSETLPTQNAYLERPKEDLLESNVIDTQEKETLIDIREKETAIDAPEKETAIDTPEKDTVIDTQEKETAVDIREKYTIIDTREKETAIDTREKETVIVQTSKSILKKNFPIDNTNPSLVSGSSRSLVEKIIDISELSKTTVKSDLKSTKLEVINGKFPVVQLHKIQPLHSTRIVCMDHKMYNCLCMNNKLSSQTVDGNLETEKNENDQTVPQIEKVITLRLEDFFKDSYNDSSSSSMTIKTNSSAKSNEDIPQMSGCNENVSSLVISKSNLSTKTNELSTQTSANHSELLPNRLPLGSIKKPRIAAPVRISHKCEYRFFCVKFINSFSYIKFFGGLNLDEIPLLKDQVLNNESVDPDMGVILAYTVMLNMLRESLIKKHCVFQRLIKADYNHEEFENLPFGIYAVCRNMIMFGPYGINEPHKLQAFRVVYKEAESGNASQVKQIPFISPLYVKQFKDIEFAIGHWWNITNYQLGKDKDILAMIYTKRIVPPVTVSAPLVMPIKLAQPSETKGQSVSNQNIKTVTLTCNPQNSEKAISNSSFMKVKDVLHRGVYKNKSMPTIIGVTNDDMTKKSVLNDDQNKLTNIVNDKESVMTPEKSIQSDYTVKLDGTPLTSLATERLILEEESVKLPATTVKNSEVMSVVYPEQKDNVLTFTSKNLITPSVKPIVNNICQRPTNSSSVESLILSLQPNGEVFTIALRKLSDCINVNLNDKPLTSLATKRLVPAKESVPKMSVKFPVTNVKNTEVMSVVYPKQNDNVLKTLNSPTVKPIINNTCQQAIDSSNIEPIMLSLQPNGEVIPIPLSKLSDCGNVSDHSLKNNKQIIKISKKDDSNDKILRGTKRKKCIETITVIDNLEIETKERASHSTICDTTVGQSMTKVNSSEALTGKSEKKLRKLNDRGNVRDHSLKDNQQIIKISKKDDLNEKILHGTKRKCIETITVIDNPEIQTKERASNSTICDATVGQSMTKVNSSEALTGKSGQTEDRSNMNIEVSQNNDQSVIDVDAIADDIIPNERVSKQHSNSDCSKKHNSETGVCDVLNLETLTVTVSASKCSELIEKTSKSVAVDGIGHKLTRRLQNKRNTRNSYSRGFQGISSVKNDKIINKKNTDATNLNSSSVTGTLPIKMMFVPTIQTVNLDNPNESTKQTSILGSALLNNNSNTEPKTTNNTIKHDICDLINCPGSSNKPLASTRAVTSCNHASVTPVAETELNTDNRVKFGPLDSIQSSKKFKGSGNPNGVLLKVTVKSDSNIFKFKSRSGRLNADLTALVAALNNQVVKRKTDSTATANTNLNSIINDKVVLSYNNGSSGNATCSFVESPLPHTLASDLKHTPIIWNTKTRSFNINDQSTDQISDRSTAISHLTNLTEDSEIEIIDITNIDNVKSPAVLHKFSSDSDIEIIDTTDKDENLAASRRTYSSDDSEVEIIDTFNTDSAESSAVLYKSNLSGDPGIEVIKIDNETENVNNVSDVLNPADNHLGSYDCDEEYNIESHEPPLASLSNLEDSCNSDSSNTVPKPDTDEDNLQLTISSVRTITAQDADYADIFNEDSISIPLTPESIERECEEANFVDDDSSASDKESCNPSVFNTQQLEEPNATEEMATTSDDSNDTEPDSENVGRFPKTPLLKQTMLNLLKEAKTISSPFGAVPDATRSIEDDLELVSSNDSLPNFLQSYGIHFTDEDL